MSRNRTQNSKIKVEDSPQQANTECCDCKELSKQFNLYKDAAERRHQTLLDILAEHKVLLGRILKQDNVAATDLMEFFPINTDEKLKEFDEILATRSDQYIQIIKHLLDGNTGRNLHELFGKNIIMNFNVDGSFGKKRLRDYPNVFKAIIDVISTFSEFADKTLRAAFQRQKKKYFKQFGRSKAKGNETQEFEEIIFN